MSQRHKMCTTCGVVFLATLEFFHRDKQKPDGLRPDCKPCSKVRRHETYQRRREDEIVKTREWEKLNRNKINAHRTEKRANDPALRESLRQKCASYRANNIERLRAKHREWTKANPGLNAAKTVRARAARAAPSWLTKEHLLTIKGLYVRAACEGLQVDHIHPLRGVDSDGVHISSGLHVPWNLQLLTRSENQTKGGRVVAET